MGRVRLADLTLVLRATVVLTATAFTNTVCGSLGMFANVALLVMLLGPLAIRTAPVRPRETAAVGP